MVGWGLNRTVHLVFILCDDTLTYSAEPLRRATPTKPAHKQERNEQWYLLKRIEEELQNQAKSG